MFGFEQRAIGEPWDEGAADRRCRNGAGAALNGVEQAIHEGDALFVCRIAARESDLRRQHAVGIEAWIHRRGAPEGVKQTGTDNQHRERDGTLKTDQEGLNPSCAPRTRRPEASGYALGVQTA